MPALLVIHQGALGDFVITFPVLRRLKKKYGRVDVVCRNQYGQIASDLGLVDQYDSIDRSLWTALYSGGGQSEIKTIIQSYDHIIVFSFSEIITESIRCMTNKSVHRVPSRPAPTETVHVADFIMDHLSAGGIITPVSSELEDLSGITRDKPLLPPESRIIIHPGSGSPKKNWMLGRFVHAAQMLKNLGFYPMFITGPAETGMASELTKRLPADVTVFNCSDIRQVAAILKTAGGYIGNDSGISHLAAAYGIPAVAIFGPSDPKRWSPVGHSVQVVYLNMQCRPCFETDRSDCLHRKCLSEIDPDRVVSAFMAMFE